MKKQQVQVVFLLVVLFLCIGGYFAAKQLPDEETEITSESYTVSNVNKSDVVGMSYIYEGEIIDLVKENDEWKVKEDSSIELEQTKVDTMLDYVCNIVTDTVIENPQTLEEYGLSNPTNTICLTLSDESVVQLLVGDYMDLTGENYALLAGDSNVYTVESYIATAFEKSLEELVVVEETTVEIEIMTDEYATEETTETMTEESAQE